MLAVLQRLAIPAVLLAAFIVASVVTNRVGNEDLEPVSTEVTIEEADTPVYSVRRAPELLASPKAAEELTASLDAWIAELPSESCFIVSNGADVIYEHQSSLPLTPASNMKVLTAAAALQALGPDFRFETTVAAAEPPDENGLLNGDLYLVGGGDPILMTDAYLATIVDTNSKVASSADDLADQTVATNIADIAGAVVTVEDRYDTERAPANTPPEFLNNGLIGSLGSAIVDQGFTGFKQQYANQLNDPPPPLLRASEPAAEFAANFDDLLEARNVRISARSRVEPVAPDGLVPLLTFQSPPLSDIVQQMLTNSDNTTAELLVKELAFNANPEAPGSTTSGLLELTTQLNATGVDGSAAFAFDGSGMNAETKATCALLHDTLNISQHKETFRNALPVAGQSGTLANSFVGGPGEGRIRAKTGLLAQASALSGYFITDPGTELTFSLIVNTSGEEPIRPREVRRWQNPLPELLAPYPAGPPLSDLGPVGVDLSGGANIGIAAAPATDPVTGEPVPDDGTDEGTDLGDGTDPGGDGADEGSG